MSTIEWVAPLLLITVTLGLAAFVNGPKRLRLALSGTFLFFLCGCTLVIAYLADRAKLPILFLIGFAMVTVLTGVARATPLVTVRRQIMRLSHPQLRGQALSYIHSWAVLFRPGPHEDRILPVYANVVCTAAGALLGRDMVEHADRLLSNLPDDLGDDKLEALRATLVAMTKVSIGDAEAARAAVDRAPHDLDHEVTRQMLTMARGLVAAVEGHADEALELLDGVGEDEGKLSGFKMAVLAHAHAARDEPEQAKDILEQLRQAGGVAAVNRVAGQQGPASSIAQEVLDDEGDEAEDGVGN